MESRPSEDVSKITPARPEEALPADSTAPEAAAEVAAEPPAAEVPPADEAVAETPAPAEAPTATDAPSPEEAAPAAEAPTAADEAPAAEAPAATDETPAAEAPTEPAADAETAPASSPDQNVLMATTAGADRPVVSPKRGGRVTGRIIQIGEDGVFVDFGGREEGVLDVREIQDKEGNATKSIGDTVKATVTRIEGGVKLTLKARSTGDLATLLAAQKSNTPVDGKVTGVNKGGLVVNVLGVRAFCPFSQIDRHYVENPAEFVGKKMTFRVSSADERGKNVVLSRRAFLEEEMKEKASSLREGLEIGQVLQGVVARIRPFGAFVDLGGIDGLVHVSEVSHTRVKDPSEVLKVGQEIEVKIVKIDDLGGPSERISLSRKQLEPDPWVTVTEKLVPGEQVSGKIVRLVDFGAFVQLAPGVDGLIHVSALASDRRIGHPSEVVNPGDEVEVWVTSVDAGSRRISLSLVDPADRPARREGAGARRDGARRGGPRGGDRRESREVREYRERSKTSESGLTSMAEAFQRLRDRTDS